MQNSLYVHRNIFLPVSKTGFYTDMQEFYDRCLPGNSFVLNDFDAVTMRLRDNEFNLQPCRLTLSNLDPVPALIKSEAQNFLIPVLRTACERPRIPGLLENLVAMIKRNMNTPDLAGTVDITNMSISIVDNFFSSFVRDEVLLDHLDCVRASSIQSFSDWFRVSQPQRLAS